MQCSASSSDHSSEHVNESNYAPPVHIRLEETRKVRIALTRTKTTQQAAGSMVTLQAVETESMQLCEEYLISSAYAKARRGGRGKGKRDEKRLSISSLLRLA
jgi:hypothetical protein